MLRHASCVAPRPTLVEQIGVLQDQIEKVIMMRARLTGDEADLFMQAVVHVAELMGGVSPITQCRSHDAPRLL